MSGAGITQVVFTTLGRLLALLLLLLLLAVAGAVYLAGSEYGLQRLWQFAGSQLPAGISVDVVEGRLISPLTVHNLQVDIEGVQLHIEELQVHWTLSSLRHGKLQVQRLAVAGLSYAAPADSDDDDEPFELPKAIELPIGIQIDEATLDGATIRVDPETEPFVIDAASLLAHFDHEAWQLSDVVASGPLFDLAGQIRIVPRQRWTSELQADWTLRLPDVAPMTGDTQASGDIDSLRVQQGLAAPYNASGEIVIRDLLGALQLQADIQLSDTVLHEISTELPVLYVSAGAQGEGPWNDLGFSIKGQAREILTEKSEAAPSLAISTAVLEATGRYTGDSLRIEDLLLTSSAVSGGLTANGEVALEQGNRMDLKLSWQDLQWPLLGVAQYSSPAGDFQLTGPLEDYALTGNLQWQVTGMQQQGRLQISGQGSTTAFTVQQLALSGAPGELNGRGQVTWSPALQFEASLQGRQVNPGAILPDWPGALDVAVQAAGQQNAAGLVVNVPELEVEGRLREQPLKLTGKGRYTPAHSVIDALTLIAGATRLEADGSLQNGRLDFEWSVDSADLATTWPGAAGALQGTGVVQGALARPLLGAQLSGKDLRYEDLAIEKLVLDARIDASGGEVSSLAASLEQVMVGEERINVLTVTGDGRPSSHSALVVASSERGSARLAVAGQLDDQLERWQFTLNEAELTVPDLAPWVLAAPAAGEITAEAQAIDRLCLRSDGARLCADGKRANGVAQAAVELEAFALGYLQPLLPPDIQLNGQISGTGNARLPAGGEPDVMVKLHSTAAGIVTRDSEGEPLEALRLGPGDLQASLSADGLQVQADLPVLPAGGIQLQASVPGGTAALTERPLSGRLDMALENLDVLEALSPEIDSITGDLRGNLTLSGSLAAPALNGELALKAPLMTLGRPGIEVKETTISVAGNGRALALNMQAMSGGGTLAATGDVLFGDAGTRMNIQLKGEQFRVMDTRDARVWASPDLEIALAPERIDVTGKVAIPRADITPQDLPAVNGAETVSEDQVIVRPASDPQDRPGGPDLYAKVRVIVGDPTIKVTEFVQNGRNFADKLRRLPGDKVRFEGFGLKAIFAGDLLVTQQPGEEALGNGDLRVVLGEYRAYGQDLTIRDGKVLFAGGPVDEPVLDMRAIRRPAEGILVGVKVRGPLQQADYSLYSDPASMTQSEQLSWLVLGRPLNNASSEESSLIAQAALALGIKGSGRITQGIGEQLGVDEFGIEAGNAPGEQAAFVVGKYLTPKLYVSYGLGLFQPVSTVRLRYSINPRLHLETQSSGSATGGDIIYSIERGGD